MQTNGRGGGINPTPRLHQENTPLQYASLPGGLGPADPLVRSIRLRRAGSEWLTDNSNGFLRKAETRKSRRRKVQVTEEEGIIIARLESSDNIKQCVLPMDNKPENSFLLTEYPESPVAEAAAANRTISGEISTSDVKNHNDQAASNSWQELKLKPRTRPVASLSSGQLHMLRKLATIKLKTILDSYCPNLRNGFNWELPKLKRKLKASDYKDKTVFGVPLTILLQRNGKSLPTDICKTIQWLRENAMDQTGLFRKSGVKSRIQKLKAMVETNSLDFTDQQAYDVADMLKQYFRELPEVLFTNKLSETLIIIFQYVAIEHRAEAVQWVLLLLPDENSEVLQVLLDLLHDVASHAGVNQMTTSNLAVCLVPTLFYFRSCSNGSNNGTPSHQELDDNRAAHDCLQHFIRENTDLFTITVDLLLQCHFNYLEDANPVALSDLGSSWNQDWRKYQELCITSLLKAAREKSTGWVNVYNPYRSNIEISYKKVGDEHPLDLWRACTEVEAPPSEVLLRILAERRIWDDTCVAEHIVERLDVDSDVYQYVCASEGIKPLYKRDFCVLRTWKTQMQRTCLIVETSVEHSKATVSPGAVRGLVLASRYLIEPCGSGKSRIIYLSRMDIKGKTLEWYKHRGHICGIHLDKISKSFKRSTIGPESKV